MKNQWFWKNCPNYVSKKHQQPKDRYTKNLTLSLNCRFCQKASFLKTTVSLKYDWFFKVLYTHMAIVQPLEKWFKENDVLWQYVVGTATSFKQKSKATHEIHIHALIISSVIITQRRKAEAMLIAIFHKKCVVHLKSHACSFQLLKNHVFLNV